MYITILGGVHVDAFIYSPLIASKKQGSNYDYIFHVSDWLPTLLDIASASTKTIPTNLDGVSHYNSILGSQDSSPREYMLINYYYQPRNPDITYWTTQAMAIRNDQYKLLHAYDDDTQAAW